MPKLSKEFRADLADALGTRTSESGGARVNRRARERQSYYAVLTEFRLWCHARHLSMFVELRDMAMKRMKLPASLVPVPAESPPRPVRIKPPVPPGAPRRYFDYVRDDTGQRFDSLRAAAESIGVAHQSFRYSLMRNQPIGGTTWSRLAREVIRRDADGQTFNNIARAAKAAGCSYPTMLDRLKTGQPLAGSTWSRQREEPHS